MLCNSLSFRAISFEPVVIKELIAAFLIAWSCGTPSPICIPADNNAVATPLATNA